MSSDRFSTILLFLQRHKRPFLTLVAALLALALAGVFAVDLDSSLSTMLPKGSDSRRMISFLEELDFSGRVALSISQPEETLSRSEFLAQVDAFADRLEPPLVTAVVSRMDDRQLIVGVRDFLRQAPGLLEADDYQRLAAKLTPESIERILREKFLQLIKPEGSFVAELIRRDPLDIQSLILDRLRHLSTSFGYNMKLEDRHIFSADGKHLLLLLETPVPFTDAKRSRELIGYLDEQREKYLAPSIRVDTVGAHLHTLGNEDVIKRDIRWTMSITGAAFALLFLFYFKDPRAATIFFIPFVGVLVAINLASLVMGTLSPMILGFGAVMAGISVDYAIHVYIAVRRGTYPAASIQTIIRPLILGALTTAAVFAAFFFTRIEGYRQLAFLALTSVAVSLAAAIFILPLLIKSSAVAKPPPAPPSVDLPPRATAMILTLLALASLPLALRIDFDPDIARLDGSGAEVFATEERFHTVWGGGQREQAILAVAANDFERALEKNDRLYHAARQKVGDESLTSLSSVWKSAARQQENYQLWRDFWHAKRRSAVQRLLIEKGRPMGFAEDAFKPFFDQLEEPFTPMTKPSENVLFDQLQSRFVQQKNGRTQIFTFFPDTPERVAALAPLVAREPGGELVSRRALSGALTSDYSVEMIRIATIATALMLGVACLMLKNFRLTLIALAPAGAGVLGMLALMGLLRVDANVINLIAAIVVVGLCIDYGIFYTHMHLRDLDSGTPQAVTLSAGTTLIGAGSLLFAHHPALFSIGLTLVGGVFAGYLTTVLAVPALCRLFLGERRTT